MILSTITKQLPSQPMEKESIDDIARSIQRHRDLEIAIEASNPAIGRYKVEYGGEIQQFWLTNKENNGGIQDTEDITGYRNGVIPGNRTTVTEDGRPIYKNLRLGEQLIRSTWEPIVIYTPKGAIKLLVFNSSIYKPCFESLATDLTVKSPEFKNPLLYRNLSEIFKRIQKLNEDISTLEEEKKDASEEEIEGLLKEIEKKKEEKKKEFEKSMKLLMQNYQQNLWSLKLELEKILKEMESIRKSLKANWNDIVEVQKQKEKDLLLTKYRNQSEEQEKQEYQALLRKLKDRVRSWYALRTELLMLDTSLGNKHDVWPLLSAAGFSGKDFGVDELDDSAPF